jgi:hypothetical protein
MNKNKKIKILVVSILALAVVGLAGYTIPIDTYTTTSGCPSSETIHLHLILGGSLDKIKKDDAILKDNSPRPNVGCTIDYTYKLTLL